VALKDTCVSAYESMDVTGPYNDGDRLWRPPAGRCGDPYKIFFEEPATDLPATAARWDGTTSWVAPPPAVPDITNLRFAPNSDSIHSGSFTFDVTNFTGQMRIEIDANGDGDYTDPEDVALPVAAKPGPVSVAFDGKDASGAAIPIARAIKAKAAILQTGEIHFAQLDVELRQAMTVVALNGPNKDSATLYWNDTTLLAETPKQPNGQTYKRDCVTSILDGRAGVDSKDGVHGWSCSNNPNSGLAGSWGDQRVIDDWAYGSANEAEELAIPGQTAALTLVKAVTSAPTPLGNGKYRLAYTITATNTAQAAGTYSLTDALAFAPGVTVDSATVAAVPGSIALNPKWNGLDNAAVVSAQPIGGAPSGGSTVHTYTVTATVTPPADIAAKAADCTVGAGEAGTGLLNHTTLIDGSGAHEAEACAPVPYTTINKEFVDARRLGANQFELIYRLTVTQGPGAEGIYDLTDQLQLGAPVTVNSTSVSNTTPGGITVNAAWNGAGNQSVASKVPIAAGGAHGYEARVGVTVDTAAVTLANSDCTVSGGEAGTGAMNTASMTANGVPRSDSDCVPFPATSVAKEVTSPPAPAGDGTFRVAYGLKVRNTGNAADTYDLEDQLAFSDGVDVVSASLANTAPGGLPMNPEWWKGTPPDPKVSSGVSIEPATATGATTHVYTVTVVFKAAPTLTSRQADCTDGAGEAGTGLKNIATAIVNGDRQAPKDACAEVPRTVFDKELRSIDPNPDGTFALRYQLTVDRFGNGAPYTLRDTLRFAPSATATSAKVINAAPGSVIVNTSWNGTSDPLVASNVALGDGERHTYTALVVAAVNQEVATTADRDCAVTGAEKATGFTNTAALATNGSTEEDSTCGDIPIRPAGPPSPVHIAKDVAGAPAVNDDGTSTVIYRLTVSSRGDSKQTYDLADHLRLGSGLTVKSASAVNTTPGTIALSGGWNGTTNPVIAAGQVIDPGAIHSYTVTLRVATGSTVNADQLDCTLALGQVDTGLRNTATATSNGADHTAAACTPVGVLPASIVVLPGSVSQPSVGGLLPATGTTGVWRQGVALVLAGTILRRITRSSRTPPVGWPSRP
jgi:hypothetical protein